jgi:hypothetical protein
VHGGRGLHAVTSTNAEIRQRAQAHALVDRISEITNCIVCERRLSRDREHTDTCRGPCYQRLLAAQREIL